MPRGRPAISPELRKAHTLAFRVRGGFREKLAAAAALSGKTMSEEAEARITASFDLPEIIKRTAQETVLAIFAIEARQREAE